MKLTKEQRQNIIELWLQMNIGHTPDEFLDVVDFVLYGYQPSEKEDTLSNGHKLHVYCSVGCACPCHSSKREKVELPEEMKFEECDMCDEKPGTPPLCKGCRQNRRILETVNHLIRYLKAKE